MLSIHLFTDRYGVGYHMIIEKAPSCDSNKVISLVKDLVPGAQCVLDAGAELSLILPTEQTRFFPQLFNELEGTVYSTCTIYIHKTHRNKGAVYVCLKTGNDGICQLIMCVTFLHCLFYGVIDVIIVACCHLLFCWECFIVSSLNEKLYL